MSTHGNPIGQPTIGQRLAALAGRFKKLLLGVAGGATGAGVTAVLDAVGLHVAPTLAAGIATVLAGLAVALGPANTPPGA